MIIRYTRHALDVISKHGLSERFVEERIISEGEMVREGKEKVKFILPLKRKLWIAICVERENELLVITVVQTTRR